MNTLFYQSKDMERKKPRSKAHFLSSFVRDRQPGESTLSYSFQWGKKNYFNLSPFPPPHSLSHLAHHSSSFASFLAVSASAAVKISIRRFLPLQ
jgi:hypothetical protein